MHVCLLFVSLIQSGNDDVGDVDDDKRSSAASTSSSINLPPPPLSRCCTTVLHVNALAFAGACESLIRISHYSLACERMRI